MDTAVKNKTILLANPCDAERALVRHALESNGFTVVESNCAKQTIELAMAHDAGLVLLDNLGWENPSLTTLAVLKHNARTCRIPVIMFGRPVSKEQVAEAVTKGAATWIGRQGFNLTRFVEKLNHLLEHAPREAAPTPAASQAKSGNTGTLEKITAVGIKELLSEIGPLPAFEFSLVQAMTTTPGKVQANDHIAGIVEQDPVLALETLSAAGAVAKESADAKLDTRKAVGEIGSQAFYRLVESVPPLRINLSSLWDAGCWWAHSVATSRIAAMLSKRLGLGTPAAASNAGLLHDIGYYILANHYPKHYGALFSAATEADSIHPVWEKGIIGAHHGEVGAWVMRGRGVTSQFSDSALLHHAGGTLGQVLTASSRLVTMVVQAADLLADALLPADPPLTAISRMSDEFEIALRESNIPPKTIVEEARNIVADLLTEMAYLFPQSAARSFFYSSEPIPEVAYFAPGDWPIDVLRMFFEVRSANLIALDRRSVRSAPAAVPMIVNLTRLREPAAQVEALTTLVATQAFDNRPGAVLLPAALPERVTRNLIPASWRLVCTPMHACRMTRFLAQDAQGEVGQLSVA